MDKSFGISVFQVHQTSCVCEREREREKGRVGEEEREGRERERERERENEHVLHNSNSFSCLHGVATGHLAKAPLWKPEKYNLLGGTELLT